MVGFLQLAGGTNAHTVDGLKKLGLFQTTSFASNFITLFPTYFCLDELYKLFSLSFFWPFPSIPRELKGWKTDSRFA